MPGAKRFHAWVWFTAWLIGYSAMPERLNQAAGRNQSTVKKRYKMINYEKRSRKFFYQIEEGGEYYPLSELAKRPDCCVSASVIRQRVTLILKGDKTRFKTLMDCITAPLVNRDANPFTKKAIDTSVRDEWLCSMRLLKPGSLHKKARVIQSTPII